MDIPLFIHLLYFIGICKKCPICPRICNEVIKIGKYLLMDRSQYVEADLDKKSCSGPKTTAGWKVIP